jgi:hypothetical protein
MSGAIPFSIDLAALIHQPTVENTADHKNSLLDETTIEVMQKYFHVQDRGILLKYVRDSLISGGGKYSKLVHEGT